MRKLTGLVSLALLGICATANAQESERPSSCDGPAYHAFDFWLGEWTVTDPAGELAGTSSITKEEDDCLIVERWTSARGSTGQSYNYYDPGERKWHQIWVSPSAVIDYSGGSNQRGHMLLEGEIRYRGGNTHPFRGSWVPEEDGSVTQHFEQYNGETEEWEDWFIGTYRKD